jgi:hypothetical protein
LRRVKYGGGIAETGAEGRPIEIVKGRDEFLEECRDFWVCRIFGWSGLSKDKRRKTNSSEREEYCRDAGLQLFASLG